MKKSLMLSLSCVALLNSSLGFAEEKKDEILAHVNDATITRAEYEAYKKARSHGNTALEPKTLMDELISRELLYQQALVKKVDQTNTFKKELADLRYNLLASTMQETHLTSLSFTDEELKAEYERILHEVERPMEYKARHILVKTEGEAKAILADLKAGKNFAEIAKEKSQDPGSGKNGGDLGWFDVRRMVKPFGDALIAMEKGTLSVPIETSYGWHIIELQDLRQVEAPPFDTVKEQLKQRLQGQKMREYMQRLNDKASVKMTEAFAAMKTSNAKTQ